MKQLGDIKLLNGDQSCLFREQMRIVREMYSATGGVCPKQRHCLKRGVN